MLYVSLTVSCDPLVLFFSSFLCPQGGGSITNVFSCWRFVSILLVFFLSLCSDLVSSLLLSFTAVTYFFWFYNLGCLLICRHHIFLPSFYCIFLHFPWCSFLCSKNNFFSTFMLLLFIQRLCRFLAILFSLAIFFGCPNWRHLYTQLVFFLPSYLGSFLV